MLDILFRTPSLPLATKGECLTARRTRSSPLQGVIGVSDGKRQFTTDIILKRIKHGKFTGK